MEKHDLNHEFPELANKIHEFKVSSQPLKTTLFNKSKI